MVYACSVLYVDMSRIRKDNEANERYRQGEASVVASRVLGGGNRWVNKRDSVGKQDVGERAVLAVMGSGCGNSRKNVSTWKLCC